MDAQIKNVTNPVLRKFAETAQVKYTADFGLTVYGGVDLTEFAALIVRECGEWCGHDHAGVVAMFKHFGIKETA